MRSAEAEDRKFQEEKKKVTERKTDREEAEKQIEKVKRQKEKGFVCMREKSKKPKNGTINAGRY